MEKKKTEKTLSEMRPDIVKEWNFQKNTNLTPSEVSCGSTVRVWWKCGVCGKEWQASINNRTKKKNPSGCPECAKRKRIETYMNTKLNGGKNSLLSQDPELASQWDQSKNGDITPNMVNVNAKKCYWWICPECGYSWKASPGNRHSGSGCPICKGNKTVWAGHNDLASQKPELLMDWDYSKNTSFEPSTVRVFSGRKAWWKCHVCGYEWYCSIAQRSSGNGCAYCAGQIAVAGKNDLATTNPEVATEWNYERNGTLKPTQFKAGSDKEVWWKCVKCSHEWKAAIKTRKIAGCPACAGRFRSGYNDIVSLKPELLKDWNYTKNKGVTPDQIAAGSHHKVWWLCHVCGYEWASVVKTRKNGVGCPRCSGRITWKGHNDFATKCPDLLKEWDYNKNPELPDAVSFQSDKKIWWKCSVCGNSYQMRVHAKTRGNGCPKCNRIYHSSFPEQAIFYYLCKAGIQAENGYRAKWLGKSEIDIFISSLCLGIEYDGKTWHRNIERDKQKSQLILSHGIRLIRVREPECPDFDDNRVITFVTDEYSYDGSYINRALNALFKYINTMYHTSIEETVDVAKDHIAISASYENLKLSKSLASNYPQLKKEWDYEKNSGLVPEQVTGSSHIKVWWKCILCGFSWQASVDSRTRGQGCPACSHTVVYPGVSDLATVDPILVTEWNYEKNGNVKPEDCLPNSGRRVWWKCVRCGYEWETSISNRHNGSKCPACVNRVLYKGVNDLASQCSELLNDWDYQANKILPNEVIFSSKKSVQWKCHTCGYIWQAQINTRSIQKQPCPFCNGYAVWPGKNDFASLEPELMKDWDYSNNIDLNPREMSHLSTKKVSWKCHKCGHSWKSTLKNRVEWNSCPRCGKIHQKRVVKQSFKDMRPRAVALWNFEKNADLSPDNVSYGSNIKVWCKCPVCATEWESAVKNINEDSCPNCMKKKTSARITSAAIRKHGTLLEHFPKIANQWDYEKNDGLLPEDVSPSSAKKVWWKCDKCGYSWITSINARTSVHTGCPFCAGKVIWEKHNDLATTNPELIQEWDFNKNSDISPYEVGIGSHKKVWWKCHVCGYGWETKIESRKKGNGCLACGNKVVWKGHNDLVTRFPEIASQWDYEANVEKPDQVTPGSTKKYGWICQNCGWHWEASVNSRTAGHGCPKCARRIVGEKARAKRSVDNEKEE